MNFTVETRDESVYGSSLMGEIDIGYDELVAVFGEPGEGDGYKVEVEWMLRFEDGTFATIYDYKVGKTYNGPDGVDKEDNRDWHVGGFSKEAVKRVVEALGLPQ